MNDNDMTFIPKNWLTSNEAAKILDYAPGTLANMRVTGDGPDFIKLKGSIYYTREAIETFIEDNACTYRSTTQWKDKAYK